ncbi:ABC transporter permease [Zavarzinia sp. CC-PAN008]|uniref:ABC transporter permease n=1 Tax=Zavarzinia sp. CC-PAN008 TaxID=3243332 RepID=UPI003F74A648
MGLLAFGDTGYGDELWGGAVITMQLALWGYVLALSLGLVVAIVTQAPATRLSGRVIQGVWRVYASIFMGVPSILVMFLFYFGGSAMLQSVLGLVGLRNTIDITPFWAGVAGLTLVYGAYIVELLRGAIRNVPKGQFEACSALALSRRSTWLHVILPQVARLALPGLINLWIIVLKDTALVSLVGLNDLVAQAKMAAGTTKLPFLFFTAAALFFVAFSWATLSLSRQLELRLARGIAREAT